MKSILMILSLGLITLGLLIEDNEKTIFMKDIYVANRKERGIEKYLSIAIGITGALFMAVAILGGK